MTGKKNMKKIKKSLIQKKTIQSIIMSICTIMIISGLSGCTGNKDTGDDVATDEKKNGTSIYLVAMDGTSLGDSLDAPTIGCSDKLVAVQIDQKLSPQEALEELFAYEKYNEDEGLYNVFGLSDNLKVEKMVIANDFAIVTLSKDLIIGGMCDEPRVHAQITQTLTQFDDIDGVDVFVGDESLGEYLSEKGSDE